MAEPDPLDTAALRRMLIRDHPWLSDTDLGPQAVSAGECDLCLARLWWLATGEIRPDPALLHRARALLDVVR